MRLSFGAETDTVDVQVGDYYLAATEARMAAGASADGRPDKVEALDAEGEIVEVVPP